MQNIFLEGFLIASAIVFGPLIIIGLICRSHTNSKRAKIRAITDKIFSYLKKSEKVKCDKVYIDCKAQNALSFNKEKTKLLRVIYDDFRESGTYTLPKYEKVYSARDIISVEIMSDKQVVTSFSGSKNFIWFDGVAKNIERVKELSVKLVLNDEQYPMHLLTLYGSIYSVHDYNNAHDSKEELELAKAVAGELVSFLGVMINKDRNIESETNILEDNSFEKINVNLEEQKTPNSVQVKDNLIDRLKEITDLKKEDLITEEEFLVLKKELFSKTR